MRHFEDTTARRNWQASLTGGYGITGPESVGHCTEYECWNSQVAGNMRRIGCRVNNSARWLIYTCEPYRAGGSNPNSEQVTMYMY